MKKNNISLKAKNLQGEIFAAMSALGVSGYFIINGYVYVHYAPASIDYVSTFMAIAGAIGLASLVARSIFRPKDKAVQIPHMMGVGIIAGAAVGMTVIGQKYTLAANAAILTTLAVITTIIFSHFILKQTLHRSKLPWVLLLLAGVYIAIMGFSSYHPRSGDWIIIGACVFFGLSNTLTKVVMNKNSPGVARDYRFVTAGTIFGLLIILHPRVSFVHTAGAYPYFAALFFWLGILFFNKAVKAIGPSNAIVINNSHLVITTLLSIPLLSEHLTINKTIGAVLVLLAIQKISSKKH